MRTGSRRYWIAIPLACSALLAGCAQSSPLLSRRETLGTLKTAVSRLEYENEQLRREVASKEADVRRVGDSLAEVQARNDELVTLLDDARHPQAASAPSADFDQLATPADSLPTEPQNDYNDAPTAPASQKTRRGHRPPFTQIRGPNAEPPAPAFPNDFDSDDFLFEPQSYRRPRDPGAHLWLDGRRGWIDDQGRWSAVARDELDYQRR